MPTAPALTAPSVRVQETNGYGESSPIRVCVIDLGTNSFHALIVDVFPNGTFSVIDKIKEMVRLGENGLVNHRLTDAAVRRGFNALRRIRMLADGWGVNRYLAFATSAIREAENGGSFIDRARQERDIHIRTIDGSLEALLIYKAVSRAVDIPNPTLIVDIGGGSTEFIVGTNKEHFFKTSLKIGAGRMTERFITTDPVSKEEFRQLRAHFRQELEPVFVAAREHGVKHIVGSSGTMENLMAAVVQANGTPGSSIYHQTVSAVDVREITKKIMTSARAERARIAGIDQRRLNQIVAGAILVDVLVKDLGIETMAASADALREGMVLYFIDENYRTIQRLSSYTNVRRRSVYEMAYRFQWEEPHVEHVKSMALQLFDECASLHNLGDRERELLEYGAILHDIGNIISYSSHHKHAIYLIKQAELNGFTVQEISIIANVARYHRKSMPKKSHPEYTRLSPANQQIVRQLASFLRLANGLDRSHFQNVTELSTNLNGERLLIRVKTKADPQLEVWAGRRSSDLFEQTFGRKVEFVVE